MRSGAWTWYYTSTPRRMRPRRRWSAWPGSTSRFLRRCSPSTPRGICCPRPDARPSDRTPSSWPRSGAKAWSGSWHEADFEFDPEDIGTQPVRFFVVEYLREAAFELLEDELPYGFTAEVEEFREAEQPVYIRVTLFVERESQKRIVIGAGGQTIKAIGALARRRIEALIGEPVYLDCWVKVLPHWRKSATALTRFGFPESEMS
jgi:hypothetical protein